MPRVQDSANPHLTLPFVPSMTSLTWVAPWIRSLPPIHKSTQNPSFVGSDPQKSPTGPPGRAAVPPCPNPHARWTAAPPPRTRTSAGPCILPALACPPLPAPSPAEGPHGQAESPGIAETLYVETGGGGGPGGGGVGVAGGVEWARTPGAGVPSTSCRTEVLGLLSRGCCGAVGCASCPGKKGSQ